MLIFMLLIATLLVQQDSKIVTCEVVEPDKSVACPEGGKMVLFTFTDADEAKTIFDEWRLVAPTRNGGRVNGDAPLITSQIRRGDKVKAIITDNKFTQITECNVRVWHRLNKWRKPGEIPPNPLYTQPDDCQPWYGKQ